MPQMGERLPNTIRAGFQNDCTVFKVSEDVVAPLEDTSPTTATNDPSDSRPESDLVSGVSAASNDAFKAFAAEQLNWLPLSNNQTETQGQEVHRTLQGLVLGSVSRSSYSGPVDSSSTGYGNSGSSNGVESGLSPDIGHSSYNRPTLNSTTPLETRANVQARQKIGDGVFRHLYGLGPMGDFLGRSAPTSQGMHDMALPKARKLKETPDSDEVYLQQPYKIKKEAELGNEEGKEEGKYGRDIAEVMERLYIDDVKLEKGVKLEDQDGMEVVQVEMKEKGKEELKMECMER
jgi:hypothetical protein